MRRRIEKSTKEMWLKRTRKRTQRRRRKEKENKERNENEKERIVRKNEV
jgi:hypothetical protein